MELVTQIKDDSQSLKQNLAAERKERVANDESIFNLLRTESAQVRGLLESERTERLQTEEVML